MNTALAHTRLAFCAAALATVAACAPTIPDSAKGVGFGDYVSYQQRREAVLQGTAAPVTVRPPEPDAGATSASNDPDSTTDDAARRAAREANSGVQPVEASPDNPAPKIVENAVGISDENNFEAVSSQRSIQGDAALLASNRARYKVIEPTALPTRPGTSEPNIVEYALQTTNPVGVPLYSRPFWDTESRNRRACAKYASPDLAQEDFLASGGPEKDRKALDPDGDGFACNWDPAPFRAVRGN